MGGYANRERIVGSGSRLSVCEQLSFSPALLPRFWRRGGCHVWGGRSAAAVPIAIASAVFGAGVRGDGAASRRQAQSVHGPPCRWRMGWRDTCFLSMAPARPRARHATATRPTTPHADCAGAGAAWAPRGAFRKNPIIIDPKLVGGLHGGRWCARMTCDARTPRIRCVPSRIAPPNSPRTATPRWKMGWRKCDALHAACCVRWG